MSIEATTEAEAAEWQSLINHDEYEICREFPYQIRRKDNGRVVKKSLNGQGHH